MCRLRPVSASLRFGRQVASIAALGLALAGCAKAPSEHIAPWAENAPAANLADLLLGLGALDGSPSAARPARMSNAEAEALIARAIVEHEMRRP